MRDFYTTGIKKSAVVVLGVGTAILVARMLGPGLRGEWAYVLATSSILTVAFNFGANYNYQSQRRSEGPKICLEYTIFAGASLTTMLFAAIATGAVLGFRNVNVTAVLISAFSVCRLQVENINLIENIRTSAFIRAMGAVSEISLLSVLGYTLSPSVEAVATAFILKESVVIAFSIYSINATGHLRQHKHISPITILKRLKHILTAGTKPYLLTIAIALNYKMDFVFLRSILGPEEISIGVFAIGVFLAETAWVVSDVFKDVQIKRTSQGGPAKDTLRSFQLGFWATSGVAVVFLAIGLPAVNLAFGPMYNDSYYVTLLMFIATLPMIVCKIIGTYYVSTNRMRIYLFGMSLAVVANAITNVFLIPIWGIWGAVIASVISYFIPASLLAYDFCDAQSLHIAEFFCPTKEEVRELQKRLFKT